MVCVPGIPRNEQPATPHQRCSRLRTKYNGRPHSHSLVIHLATKQDEENLRALRKRLPDRLLEEVFQEEDDAYEAASADIGVDTADKITVGLRS